MTNNKKYIYPWIIHKSIVITISINKHLLGCTVMYDKNVQLKIPMIKLIKKWLTKK